MSSVVGLLNPGGPFAVFRRIWAVVVNALNGIFGTWFWSHVSVESGEVIPSWVNCYAPATIVMIANGIGIIASLAHTLPRKMFWGTCHAMRGIHLCCSFHVQTTTTLGETCMKAVAHYDNLVAAVTLAKPRSAVAFVWGTFDDNQPSISYPGPVNQFGHFILSKMKAALGRCKMLSRNLRQGAAAFHFMIAPYKLRDKCILA